MKSRQQKREEAIERAFQHAAKWAAWIHAETEAGRIKNSLVQLNLFKHKLGIPRSDSRQDQWLLDNFLNKEAA